jgi:hypothetical protein
MGKIVEKGMYFAKNEFYQIIKSLGGEWNDTKFRPIVTLMQSSDNPEIYWAIPMGNLDHRNKNQQQRLQKFLSRKEHDISSCYYHVGKTDKDSIFFISDVVPITIKYIEREYLVGPKNNNKHYVIKNPKLISELERKVGRIVRFEKNYTKSKGKPKFRQRFLDIYNYLEQELIRESIQFAQRQVSAARSDNTDLEL